MKPVGVPRNQRTAVLHERRRRLRAWQQHVRDPSLTLLLVLELCTVFLAEPLAARGLPIARGVADMLVLALVFIVVALSQRHGATLLIVLGVAATGAGFFLGPDWPPPVAGVVRRGGNILVFSALTWV